MKINANKAIIISDTHLGARSNSAEWLTTMTDWFREDFIPRAKELYEPGTVLIHTGDVFDNRQSINLMVLHEGMSLFEELGQIFDAIYIIAGNHDVMKKTSNDISSPTPALIKMPSSVK
jgi:DNA repair exonuclease SbcCD nuclease subunit